MLCRVLIWTTGRAALQWQEPSETAQTGQHVHRGTVSLQYCELISVYVLDAILRAHFSLCERCFSKTILWASIYGFWGSGSMPDGSNILCISALNQDTLWLYCKCHLKLKAWVTNCLYVITMRAGYEDTKHLCSS